MSIVKHRRGSTERWNEVDPIIERGEIVVEYCEDGSTKLKVGNDEKFSNTPYIQGSDNVSGGGSSNVSNEQIEAINEKIDTIDESITDLTSRVETLENSEDSSVDLTDITSRVETLEALDINTKLETVNTNVSDLTSRVETLENSEDENVNVDLSPITNELADITARLEILENSGDIGNVDLSSITKELTNLSTRVETLENSGVNVDLSSITNELADITARLEILENSEVDIDLTPITEELTSLTNRVETLENSEVDIDLTPITNELADITARVETLENSEVDIDLTPITNELTSLNTNIADLTTRVETLENSEGENGSLENITNEIASINTDIADLTARVETNETGIAVANSRMDTFVALKDGSTTGDAELADIRVSYDGTTYETAGEAVRSLGNELSYLKNNLQDFIDADAVDGLYYNEGTNQLYLTSKGEPVGNSVTIVGGGGGGVEGYSLRIVNKMSSNILTVAQSKQNLISIEFYEKWGNVSTGKSGTVEISYKLSTDSEWIPFRRVINVLQGTPFSIDVAGILVKDTPVDIQFTVIGGESGEEYKRSLTFQITQVEAGISADRNFNPYARYTGNFEFKYLCIGLNLNKTVYFEIDDEICYEINIGTSHNTLIPQIIEMLGKYEYGVHDLKVYFKTEDGAMSNVLQYAILYDDGNGTAPMIGVNCKQTEYNYGDIISLDYVVYTPNQETTDELSIRVYSKDDQDNEIVYDTTELVGIINNKQQSWNGTSYPSSGTVYIEFKSKETIRTVELTINEIQSKYDLKSVSTGLIYSYSANGRSNNDVNKDVYKYAYTTSNGVKTQIEGQFTGFNWVSNGYIDNESLTLSGDSRHTIELPMFSTNYIDKEGQIVNLENIADATVTTSGRTFEIEFKVTNVTDINARIIECMSNDHAGFVITPQSCYLLSANGQNVKLDSTGFIENEESIAAAYIKDNTRIRVSFVIQPLKSISYTNDNGELITGQCINIFINGEFAKSFIYPDNARFVSDKYIKMGSNTCILNVYDIRIYNRGLNKDEILQNYKASPVVVQDKISRFEDNDILTDNTSDIDIDYYKAINKYPCLLITGDLSPYKDDDRNTGGTRYSGSILTKPDGNGSYTTEFSLMDRDSNGRYLCYNKVQGTSSVKFPIKNFKFYLRFDKNGESSKFKYALKGLDEEGNALSIPESTLCWKADFMSSDHANTFNANLADTLFTDITPSQLEDPRVQNTIYGFRCLLFRRNHENGDIYFVGDGALNNDKSNSKTFGLECDGDSGNNTTRQKWEFLNNTEALCSFQTDRFYEMVKTEEGSQVKRVTLGLESMYPDQGDLEDEGLEPNYDYLQLLFTWVYQRANFWDASTDTLDVPYTYQGVEYYSEYDYRKAIFVREFERHFNLNHTLVYYLFMEFIALCDNRAKNLFIKCEDVHAEQLIDIHGNEISINDVINMDTGEVNANMIDWENSSFAIWYPSLYDLDSGYGVENSGYLQIPYYADWSYQLNGTQKFNGYESRLWLMFEDAFANKIQATAQELTEKKVEEGALSYEALYKVHIEGNAKLVCPAVVNQDMTYKYEDPWVEGFVDYSSEGNPVRHISDYKYLQRGSRTEQKDAFIYRRSNMLYSKYKCKKFLNNNINFRCGTNGGVSAINSGISITANQTLYPAVKFGDGDAAVISGAKTDAGNVCVVTKPGSTSSDKVGFSDTIYIAGGTFLTDIGDISKFRPYELQLQNATGIRHLTIGSDEEGYENVQLKKIDTSSCRLLEELNVMGCTALGNLDLSKNGILKRLYASKSSVQSVILANGGVVEELYLGDIVDLEILNQANLKIFECTSYDSLNRLHIENTPNIPVFDILKNYMSQLTGGIRIVGLHESLEDDSFVRLLLSDDAKGKYIDASGTHIDDANRYPLISGSVHVPTIRGTMLKKMNKVYPELTVTYDTLVADITYMNDEGTTVLHQYTIYNGENATDIIKDGMYAKPTKDSTAQYDFTYGGWSRIANGDPDPNALKKIDEDITVYIAFHKAIKSYDINFYNADSLIYTARTEYGSDAIFVGDLPIKLDTKHPDLYEFVGWQPKPEAITGTMNCYAQYYFIGSEDTVYQFVLSDFDYSLMDSNQDGVKDAISLDIYNGVNAIGRIPSTYDLDKTYLVYKIGIGGGVKEVTGFKDKADLEIIYLPNTIGVIAPYAFWGCTKLTLLDLPESLTRIESYSFAGCKSLKTVKIPESVTSIGSMGFYDCGFTEVYIPKNITYIGMYGFGQCKDLTEITFSADIDYSSLTIHAEAFDDCPNLTTINVPWSKGDVSGDSSRWGAVNATVNYNYVEEM